MNALRIQRRLALGSALRVEKVPRRWHSGPLYKNAQKPEDPVDAKTSASSTDGSESIPTIPTINEVKGRLSEEHGNPHRNFYKSYSLPIMKVVLGALLTYQVVYWSWLKLGGVEKEKDGLEEISTLKKKLVEVAQERKVSN